MRWLLVNMVVISKTCGLPITVHQYDEIFADHDSKTIGQLLRRARAHQIPIPDDTMVVLDEALAQRNYLNHDFYAEHAGHFMTEMGRKAMIERLRELIDLFQRADQACQPIYAPLMQRMGVTQEIIDKEAEKMISIANRQA